MVVTNSREQIIIALYLVPYGLRRCHRQGRVDPMSGFIVTIRITNMVYHT